MTTTKTNIQLTRLFSKFDLTIQDIKRRFFSVITTFIFVNLAIILFQFFYLQFRYEYINDLVPFWYTRTWGDLQFGRKEFLYFIPSISLFTTFIGLLLTVPVKRYYMRFALPLISYLTTIANLLLSFALVRIILSASVPFEPFVPPLYVEIFVPGVLAFLLSQFVLPQFIKYAQDHDLMTNPTLHQHPGMLLSEPSARGGGFVYGVLFILLAVIYVGFPSNLLAFYLALLLLSLLGYMDDYQNTHPETKLRILENPFIRLVFLFFIVSIVSTLGTRIFAISNPLGGIMPIDSTIISAVITTVWIVWVLNVLSWSNGIDGQYAGIIGVASVLLVLLALRYEVITLEHKRVAVLAALSAGLSLGFIRFTWHPSKIMWGFGAMSAGLVLSVLSILISSKIITSMVIILIPFMDASVTVVRRILQGKNPLKGDRGHLHHLLLNRGWSVRKIAIFYWVNTAFFGYLGYLTADKLTIQAGLTIAGIAGFILILLNLKLRKDIIAMKNPLPD